MTPLYIGLGITIIASLLQGSFVVPMAYAKGWKWENSWIVFSILGMIVFNWIFAAVTVPGLLTLYSKATMIQLLIPIVFGLLWGIGAICFGLGLASVGLALGYAIIMGIVLGMGAFIPMLCLHPASILTMKGMIVLLGLLVMLIGVSLGGLAGIHKEREQGTRTGEITKTTNISLGCGLVICLVAGLFSSLNNVGYALSEPLITLAQESGVSPRWAGNAVWTLIFTAGGVVNILYCVFLMIRNRSFVSFKEQGFVKNLALIAFMSLMWIGSFVIYGIGANEMGKWGTVIGWSVFIALSIALGNVWGVIQGEWKNTKSKSRNLMLTGMGVLALAILIFAWGAH